MTLILGAIGKETIVVTADGAEFCHYPDGGKVLEVENRQKLFPVNNRPIVLAVHGQNRLIPLAKSEDEQVLVGNLLAQTGDSLGSFKQIEALAQHLREQLSPIVAHTFPILHRARIHETPLELMVLGFDDGTHKPQCFEIEWPLWGDPKPPGITRIGPDERESITIFHGGSGATYAKAAFGPPNTKDDPNRIKNARLFTDFQAFVRRIYQKAEKLQPEDAPEFGGHRHEVTIKLGQWFWSTPTLDPAISIG